MHRHNYHDFRPMIRGFSAIHEMKPLLTRLLSETSTLRSGLDLIEDQLSQPSVGGSSVAFGKVFRAESESCLSNLVTDESKAAFCTLVIDFAFAMFDTPSWHLQAAARDHYTRQLHSMMSSSPLQLAS